MFFTLHRDTILRNSFSSTRSINRIPGDVLYRIFKCIRDDETPDLSSEAPYLTCTAQRATTNWIPVTHVCSQWRRESLGSPLLWSYIHLGSSTYDQMKEYLKRSKDVPLHVEIRYTSENTEEVERCIQYLVSHAHRIKTLLVRLVCYTSMDLLVPLFENLRDVVSLRILSFPMRAMVKNLQSSTPLNQLHALRNLQLCCVLPIPQLQIQFANVTDLNMEWSGYEICPSWDEFALFLGAFLALKNLKIGGYTWKNDPEVNGNTMLIPTLRSLDLSLTKDACLRVLDYLNLSMVTRITISCTDYHLGELTYPNIIPTHITETTPCSNLRVLVAGQSIAFSSTLRVNNVEQHLKITLFLVNVKGELSDAWIDRIIDHWVEIMPLENTVGA